MCYFLAHNKGWLILNLLGICLSTKNKTCISFVFSFFSIPFSDPSPPQPTTTPPTAVSLIAHQTQPKVALLAVVTVASEQRQRGWGQEARTGEGGGHHHTFLHVSCSSRLPIASFIYLLNFFSIDFFSEICLCSCYWFFLFVQIYGCNAFDIVAVCGRGWVRNGGGRGPN